MDNTEQKPQESSHLQETIKINELHAIVQKHQDQIDISQTKLASKIKTIQPMRSRPEVEQEGRNEWLKQNQALVQKEKELAKENRDYIAAFKEHKAKSDPKFYEFAKKNDMSRETQRLNKWQKDIETKQMNLTMEKVKYLQTPEAMNFVEKYVADQTVKHEIDLSNHFSIRKQQLYLRDMRAEISGLNFAASGIKNREANITVNGDIKDINNLLAQSKNINEQLSVLKTKDKSLTMPRTNGMER